MALSVYNSNWAPLQPELDMELLAFQHNFFYPEYPSTTTNIDPLLFHDQPNHDSILPYLAPPPPLDHNSIDIPPPPPQEFDYSYPYQYQYQHSYPKRQKCCYEDENYLYYPEEELLMPSLTSDVFVPNPPLLLPEFSLPEFYGSPVVLPAFDYYGCGEEEANSSGKNIRASGGGGGGDGGGSLSAQSVAARQRRRKITEKTQELGKLIPGGHKMNTAKMFHAASKYIKYLQAQVGILECMGSTTTQENEEALHLRELQALALSPCIQEKLNSSEKCLVPEKFVETLANDPELQSNSPILDELHQLIHTSSG
ncbi:hypothetical protein Vadar_029995 [Vaccinium darrowii]|uniref:Uncharacterized protein n=1 Tax=Vaccinium darrowii TaxID=229202 RepID=A0ACB7XD29_9ERIC|nr:hypothetical protein Vadar_029995 [Vaccinium darrowii]